MLAFVRMQRIALPAVWMIVACFLPAWAEQAATPAEPKMPATSAGAPTSAPAPVFLAKLTDDRLVEMAKATAMTSDALRMGVEYIQKYKPLMARDLDKLYQTNPRAFRVRVTEMSQYARQLANTKDPVQRARKEQYLALEAQAEQTAVRYKEAAENAKLQIEVELKGILDKLFAFKVEDERAVLDQARKDLEEKQAALEQRVKNKDRIIDRELTRMLGLSETLAW